MADQIYHGLLELPDFSGETDMEITATGLSFGGSGFLDYADLKGFSAANFRLTLATSTGAGMISRLGYDFEGFAQALSLAYAERTKEALFVSGTPLLTAVGEYSYQEGSENSRGEAEAFLFEDCLCILPPDAHGRRVPLCFCEVPKRENYTLSLALETGESYQLHRLGRATELFFEKLCACREKAVKKYQQALSLLNDDFCLGHVYAGERFAAWQKIRNGASLCRGVFDYNSDEETPAFWFAAIEDGKAAVELGVGEASAIFQYRFAGSAGDFEKRLRYAMEAVGENREVIALAEINTATTPLYAMAVERNVHLRFLRDAMTARLIHSGNWPQKVTSFFSEF